MQLQLCLSAVAALRLQASKIEKSSGVDAEIIQVFAQLDDNSISEALVELVALEKLLQALDAVSPLSFSNNALISKEAAVLGEIGIAMPDMLMSVIRIGSRLVTEATELPFASFTLQCHAAFKVCIRHLAFLVWAGKYQGFVACLRCKGGSLSADPLILVAV